jgi:DNA-binding LacI/PurR family transcriptional regulator
MSAIADVARAAGVSKATASRALSGRGYVAETTRARVEAAAASLGFVVSTNASSLVTGRTRNVGVVLPFISRWFFAEVLEGIESSLIAAGYDLTLYQLSQDDAQRHRVFDYFLVRKRVDAVIAIGIALAPREVEMLAALQKPIVGIGGEIPGAFTLAIDDVEVMAMATRHVLELGHRRVAHIGGRIDERMDFGVHEQRLAGFRAAMTDAGLAPVAHLETAFSIPGGYAAAIELLRDKEHRPTAVVAGCDEVGFGVLLAARELAIPVPGALSVVGVDDHELAEFFALTTVRQAPAEQGAAAVAELMHALDGTSSGPVVKPVPVILRVRESTAPPAP